MGGSGRPFRIAQACRKRCRRSSTAMTATRRLLPLPNRGIRRHLRPARKAHTHGRPDPSANYEPKLGVRGIEVAIKEIKDFFEKNLANALNLTRVTAPTFLKTGTGINDDLNGTERPIRFRVREYGDGEVEIVQSLAKWKRLALARYGFREGEGLYTDMNAIRPDDRLDNMHSIYVDQWTGSG